LAPAAPRSAAARDRHYTVQRGDSLTRIARKMYEDDSNAAVQKLYVANRGKLSGPDSLAIGMVLLIPR